jgi:DNA repair exonuclease SbcCD ATPase subunit
MRVPLLRLFEPFMGVRYMRTKVALLAGAAALVLAACGDDSSSEEEESESSVTPEQAITEIHRVEGDLGRALATYRKGDDAAAAELVSETYLQHFELVEGPLEEADAELNEELEEQIREELVDEMESGAPVAEVAALTKEIEQGLADAERALSTGSG